MSAMIRFLQFKVRGVVLPKKNTRRARTQENVNHLVGIVFVAANKLSANTLYYYDRMWTPGPESSGFVAKDRVSGR